MSSLLTFGLPKNRYAPSSSAELNTLGKLLDGDAASLSTIVASRARSRRSLNADARASSTSPAIVSRSSAIPRFDHACGPLARQTVPPIPIISTAQLCALAVLNDETIVSLVSSGEVTSSGLQRARRQLQSPHVGT